MSLANGSTTYLDVQTFDIEFIDSCESAAISTQPIEDVVYDTTLLQGADLAVSVSGFSDSVSAGSGTQEACGPLVYELQSQPDFVYLTGDGGSFVVSDPGEMDTESVQYFFVLKAHLSEYDSAPSAQVSINLEILSQIVVA